MLERLFELERNATTARTEVLAGVTTFLTMAYIIFVNPSILADAGMDKGAVFVATCLAAAFGSAFMGLYANYPIASAPGMGSQRLLHVWRRQRHGACLGDALGAVFLSGILFLIVSLTRVREWVIDSIPLSMKMAIAAGIGLFLGIIALKNAGIVAAHPATLVTVGDLKTAQHRSGRARVSRHGGARRAQGARRHHHRHPGDHGGRHGGRAQCVRRPRLAAAVDRSGAPPDGRPGRAGDRLIAIVFTFFFVDVFDNTGTLVAVAHKAGLIGEDGKLPRMGRALTVEFDGGDGGSGTRHLDHHSYIESAAGINAGGRTGLVAVTVAVLFLLALFLSPLAGSIPAFATAPALFYVACLMMSAVKAIDFADATEYVPAVVTIAGHAVDLLDRHGLAFGFIAYAGIKLLSGRWSELNAAIVVLAALFVLKFACCECCC